MQERGVLWLHSSQENCGVGGLVGHGQDGRTTTGAGDTAPQPEGWAEQDLVQFRTVGRKSQMNPELETEQLSHSGAGGEAGGEAAKGRGCI